MRRMPFSMLYVLLMLIVVTSSSHAQTQASYISVALNDRLLDFPDVTPEERDGTTYLPVRFFADAIGARTAWSPSTDTVTITLGNQQVALDLRNNQLRTSSGLLSPSDLYVKQDRVMASYRWLGEYFGYRASYIAAGPVARLQNDNAVLTDEQFYQTYQAKIDEENALHQPPAPPPPQPEPEPEPDKIAYLSFDDGPNGYTPQILDILSAHHVQATFFMLEPQIRRYPAVVQRMRDEGHALGLHGVTHDAERVYASPQALVNEMEACNAALTDATGYRTSIIRVPYGSNPYMTQPYRDAVHNAGYRMWDWNVDSYDSRAAEVPADQIVAEVSRQVQNKKNPVILFHDKKTTVQALPRVLDMLKQQGYAFRPITSSLPPVNFWNDQR
ncbi:MAG: polysaccharide deacetylase family protein [Tumebacillaceae bacterium]